MGKCRCSSMKHGRQIQGNDGVPTLYGKIFDQVRMLHAGVIDQDIDSPQHRDRSFDKRSCGFRLAKVGINVVRLDGELKLDIDTLFLDCRRIAEPVYHHISTVRSQFPGDAQSNSTGRPRYNRAFAVEHALFLVCVIQFAVRSEEHTSELQSRENLVCRLLLEKKKEK